MGPFVPTFFDELLVSFRAYLGGLPGAIAKDFANEINERIPARMVNPTVLPCLRHLDALARSAGGAERPMAELLSEHREGFRWGQTYTAADFGRHFLDNYGWMELVGTRGHFVNDRCAAGFLILGPDMDYPDHHHLAEELYVPLAGIAEWRKGDGTFTRRDPGEVIHHASMVNHAMRTGSQPLLALYLWRGGPLAQKSTITGTAGAPA